MVIPAIRTLLNGVQNRHLDAEEKAEIASLAASIPDRLATMEAVKAIEAEACAAACDRMRERYPHFGQQHELAWPKAFRDAALVLRINCQGMLLGDLGYQDRKANLLTRDINRAVGISPAFSREFWSALRDAIRERLDDDNYHRLAPYLEANIEVIAGTDGLGGTQ